MTSSSYRAQIQIGVQGQREILRTSQALGELNARVSRLNGASTFGPRAVQSVRNYNALLARTQRLLDRVAAGTQEETRAINQYVGAVGRANTNRERQNNLIQNEIRARRGLVSLEEAQAASRSLLAQRTEALAAAERRLQAKTVASASRAGLASQSRVNASQTEQDEKSIAAIREQSRKVLQGLVSTEDAQAASRSLLAQRTEALAAAEQRLQANRVDAGGRSVRRARSVNNVAEQEANNRSAEIARQQNFLRGNPSQTSLPASPGGSLFQQLGALGNEVDRVNKKLEDRYFDTLKNIERAELEAIDADKKVFAQRQKAEDEYWSDRLQQARAASVAEQRLQSQNVRTNIARSRASRGVSGFGAFSQTADLTGRFGQTRAERELQVLRRENRRLSLQSRRDNSPFKGDRTEAISSGLIGGGFPLLFGQGGGAAIGGGLGGVAGGLLGGGFGFGVSIVGTILGDAFDQLATAGKELAASLKDPTAALVAMDAAGLATGDNLKFAVQKLTELGQASQAQALVFAAINKQLGPDGVQNLNALDSEQKKLDAQYQKLAGSLQSELIPALTGVLVVVNSLIDTAERVSQLPGVKQAGQIGKLLPFVNPGFALAKGQFDFTQNLGRQAGTRAGQSRALTPDQQLNQAGAPGIAAQRELDSFNAIDKFRQAQISRANEQKDLDRQRADLVLSQERAIGDLRLSIERQVQDARIQNLARANQVADAQGQLRLQQLANSQQGRRTEFAGSDPAANAVANALADYEQAIAQLDEQSAKRKRDVALEIVNVELQAERNKADIAKQIVRLNEDSARQIARLNEGVARTNSQESRQRFDLEKKIAQNKLEVLAAETRLIAGQLVAFGRTPADAINAEKFFDTANGYLTKANEIKNQQPPPALRALAGIGSVGADTSGLDAAAARATELINLLEQVNVALDGAARTAALNKFGEAFNAAFTNPLDQATIEANKLAVAIDDFFATGVSPEIGAALQDIETRAANIVKVLQGAPPEIIKALGGIAAKNGFPATLQGFVDFDRQKGQNVRTQQSINEVGGSLVEAQKEADANAARAQDINGRNAVTTATIIALKERGQSLDSGAAQDALAIAKGIDAQNEATRRLISQQERTAQLYEDIGASIESGIVNSISAAIDGTQSLNEALSQTLKQLGQILIQFGVNSLFNQLGSGGGFLGQLFPGRAVGGPVSGGKPYFVGDNPDGSLNSTSELFIPGMSGTIIPASDTIAAAREAMADEDGGSEDSVLGAARGAMVRGLSNAERATMEQRTSSETTRMMKAMDRPLRLETFSLGSLNVVTQEEAAQLGKEARKGAVAEVFSKMKNQRSVSGLR